MKKGDITYLLREIIKRAHVDACKQLEEYDLTFSQYQALMLLRHADALTMSEVKNDLLISPAGATILIDNLVKKGLIRRGNSPKDRRKVIIASTKKGQKLIESLSVGHEEYVENLSQKIGKKDLKTVTEALKILLDFLKK